MEYRVEHGPAYSLLKVRLSPGEAITAEPGAYVLHRGEVDVRTSSGGVFKGLTRALLGGESFFLNTIVARSEAEVWLAPSLPGDIKAVEVNGTLYVQDASYLAHVGDIEVGIGWRGLKGLLAGGELVWLKLTGRGVAFLSAYGAIDEVRLGPGERATVDNMHFVALEDAKWSVKKLGGWKTFLFGGESIVVEVEGPGRVWVQTRNLPILAQIIAKLIRQS